MVVAAAFELPVVEARSNLRFAHTQRDGGGGAEVGGECGEEAWVGFAAAGVVANGGQ